MICPLQSLKNIAYGIRKPGLSLALRIEEMTESKVTPRSLIADFKKKQKKTLSANLLESRSNDSLYEYLRVKFSRDLQKDIIP